MKIELKDQLGREISLEGPPERIISLNPSQTETLVALGLEKQLVGVTKFCVHPEHLRKQIPIVGGTKKVDFEKIRKLKPDIVLCNKEENTKEIVETLAKEFSVHVTNVETIGDAIEMIAQYGVIFNKEKAAKNLCSNINKRLKQLNTALEKQAFKKVAYFIWKDPWMVVGGGTFIDHMLQLNKFENIYGQQERYPQINLKDLKEQDLDYILLSSEPFPFKNTHQKELQKQFPKAEIKLVDGEYFSWYGSRLLEAFDYFKKLQEIQ